MDNKDNSLSDKDLLKRSRDLKNLDESLWNDKCDYVDTDTCRNLNPNNYNLLVLQLNIRSILAHQHELKQVLHTLENRNSKIDILLLCETFLSKKTENMVRIPGYTYIGKCRQIRKGGGVGILIRDGIPYKRRKDLDVFVEGETESVFVEVLSKNGIKMIVGSMYRPPNTNITQFSDNLEEVVNNARKVKRTAPTEIIIGMDHNIDLLKCGQHPATQSFANKTDELGLYPTITRPTRITTHSATLIDNIYVSEQLHRNFDSMILLHDLSDHLPSLTMMKQTKMTNKEPLTFKSRCLNPTKLQDINHTLMRKDWISLLSGTTSNESFNQLSDVLNDTLNEISPVKNVRISAKRKFTEPWMTKGLEASSKTKLELYKRTLRQDSTPEDVVKYKAHRNLYNSLKRQLRSNYYNSKCELYKSNVRKLWALINNTIKKVKHRGSIIPYIKVDGISHTKPKEIANAFGRFYSQLGANLAKKITDGNHHIEEYVSKIPRQLQSLVLQPTSTPEIKKTD